VFVSPVTVQLIAAVVHVNDPGVDVAVYEAAPILAVQTSATSVSPIVPVGAPGIAGAAIGLTAVDTTDATDGPPAFVACTANV
jgi:hypothetical protein